MDLAGFEYFEPLFSMYQAYTYAWDSLELRAFRLSGELVARGMVQIGAAFEDLIGIDRLPDHAAGGRGGYN